MGTAMAASSAYSGNRLVWGQKGRSHAESLKWAAGILMQNDPRMRLTGMDFTPKTGRPELWKWVLFLDWIDCSFLILGMHIAHGGGDFVGGRASEEKGENPTKTRAEDTALTCLLDELRNPSISPAQAPKSHP